MYNLIKASTAELYLVREIVRTTIKEVYPRYYPQGAVEFFLAHHSYDSIVQDVGQGFVYLLQDQKAVVGTGSVKHGEITRMFILPVHRGKGYGTWMMDRLEERVQAAGLDAVEVDASLPAYDFYLKRGYRPVEYHKMPVENGDVLCYHHMCKPLLEEAVPPRKEPVAGAVSHITLLVSDLDRTGGLLRTVFDAREVRTDGERAARIPRRQYRVGDLWFCLMEGKPLAELTYRHIAFWVPEERLDAYVERVRRAGCEIRGGLSREGATGRSVYFYDWDNHLYQLHTGMPEQRPVEETAAATESSIET